MRRRFALAVIVLHCLLLWLLAAGFRQREERLQPQVQIISLWIDPPVLDDPRLEPPQSPRTTQGPERAGTARAAVAAPPAAPLPTPVAPQPDSNAPAVTAAPSVNWIEEGRLAGRRAGQAIATPSAEPFSEGPKGVRKECVPKKSSMKWKSEDTSKGGICILTLGYPCREEGDWHLFDEMKNPERSRSSVPHPNICD